jgi:hypothetical protein
MDADVAGQTTIGIKPSPTGAVNGQLSKGTITSADLQEPLAGKHKYDLVNLLKIKMARFVDKYHRNEGSGGQQHY